LKGLIGGTHLHVLYATTSTCTVCTTLWSSYKLYTVSTTTAKVALTEMDVFVTYKKDGAAKAVFMVAVFVLATATRGMMVKLSRLID